MEQQERVSPVCSLYCLPSRRLRKILLKEKSVINLAIVNYTINRRNRRASNDLQEVQGFTVVDKSDFHPSRLTVPSDSLYNQEALHVSYFKRRGSLWLSTCSCFCLCSSFSSLSRYFVVFPRSIFSLPILKLRGDERWSTVSSNPAPWMIAPPVVWPPASQQVLIHRLGRCGHGTR